MPIKKTKPKVLQVVSKEVFSILNELSSFYENRVDDLQEEYNYSKSELADAEREVTNYKKEVAKTLKELESEVANRKANVELDVNAIYKARSNMTALAQQLIKAMMNVDKIPRKKKRRKRVSVLAISEPAHALDVLESRNL